MEATRDGRKAGPPDRHGCGDATIRTYDETSGSYAEKRDRNPLFWEDQCKQLIGLMRGCGSILEAGCGPGIEARYFIEKGCDVTGIDASEEMLAQARLRAPNGTFMKMDMRDLRFDDGTFSGVWCCASLLHLSKEEAPSAVREFRRVIKDDGTLFVSLKKGDGEGIVQSPDGRKRFFAFYRGDEVEKLVAGCGFVVMDGYEFEKFGETWICIFAVPAEMTSGELLGEQACQDLSRKGTTPILACAQAPSSKAGVSLL